MIHFITGNKNKFEEVKSILQNVEQLDIDLPEIQETDAHKVIEAKLREAFNHREGEFIVEGTSLYFDCLNGLPGTLIKWFMKSIGNEGLVNLVTKYGNNKATAKTVIGYAKSTEEIHYFEGEICGTIVTPRALSNFGWDPIFLPDGHQKTFAEMDASEKNEMSMRRIATQKLRNFLER